jgi:hypothetical protein
MPPRQTSLSPRATDNRPLSSGTLAQNFSNLSLNTAVRTSTPPVVATREPLNQGSDEEEDEEESSSDESTDDNQDTHQGRPVPAGGSTSAMASSNGSASGTNAQTPQVSLSTGTPTFKVKEPDIFEGSAEKYKSFMVQLELVFRLQRTHFPDENTKVLYAATFLRGKALVWFQPFLQDFLDPAPVKTAGTVEIFSSFESFREKLKSYSGVHNEEKEAERKLYNLKQLGSVSNYAAQFRSLATYLDWDDSSLASHFYRGLKEEIRKQYVLRDRPTTLQTLIDDASLLDARINELRAEQGTRTYIPSRGSSNKTNQTKARQPYYGPMPMDLDQTEKKPKRQFRKKGERLSEQERRNRLKKGHCLYCDKPGHIAKDCRAKEQKQQHNAAVPKEAGKARRSGNPIQTQAISMTDYDLPTGGRIYIDQGKAEIMGITATHVHVKTRYWKRLHCDGQGCEVDKQHDHITYAPYENAKAHEKILRIHLCENIECREINGDTHIHNRDNQVVALGDPEWEPEEDNEAEQELLCADQGHNSEYETEPDEPTDMAPDEDESGTDLTPRSATLGRHLRRLGMIMARQIMTQEINQENGRKQKVERVHMECHRRGVLTPKCSETIRDGFRSAEFPCERTQCPLRTIPHIHVNHQDPYLPGVPITREEATEQASKQRNLCENPLCGIKDKAHFHSPKNNLVE